MRYIITLILLALTTTTANASVVYVSDTKSLTISGPTTKYQFNQVVEVFKEEEVDIIFMWGNGGLYYVGISIGHLLADSGATVIIPSGKTCISACGFAALSAPTVEIKGEILLHRPYLMTVDAQTSIEEISAHSGVAYIDGHLHLTKVGYSDKLMQYILAESTPCLFLVVKKREELLGDTFNLPKRDRCKKKP